MTLADLGVLVEPGVGHLVGAIITGLVSLQTFFLKWLIQSFDGLRKDLKQQAVTTQEWLRDHEVKDQTRHEENLYRFEKIGIALARLGHYEEIKQETRKN